MQVTRDDLRDVFPPERLVWLLLYIAMVIIGVLGLFGYIPI